MSETPGSGPPAGRGREPAAAPEWGEPRSPEEAAPTFWPSILALGACFALWGVLTSPWMILAGVAATGLAVAGWIRETHDDPLE